MADKSSNSSDDAKAKFKEALERKKLKSFKSDVDSPRESSQSQHQGPAGAKRMFRRKSGNG
jgi:hypothetical protein